MNAYSSFIYNCQNWKQPRYPSLGSGHNFHESNKLIKTVLNDQINFTILLKVYGFLPISK